MSENYGGSLRIKERAEKRKMVQEKKRILLIGERPDIELFAMLGEEGYEVAALETPHRARAVTPLYKPQVIIVHLRYPKDIAILEECLALAGRVPVIAAISLIARQPLVKAVKEKAASFVVLPVKPQTLRETLRSVELSEDEGQVHSAGKKSLDTGYPGEKITYPGDSL
ncbi:MAG: hypothetical protein HYU46_04075 [Deltaproteobacteria bacterium]|nr:hypothetical protein [Deltaproteobacteria bacterium]MBI2365229.1 hypothetical protein [Deltaproteobacteria bacterium]